MDFLTRIVTGNISLEPKTLQRDCKWHVCSLDASCHTGSLQVQRHCLWGISHSDFQVAQGFAAASHHGGLTPAGLRALTSTALVMPADKPVYSENITGNDLSK